MKMKEKDIDLIEKLNFENWIEANLQLVKFIGCKPRSRIAVHRAKRFGSGRALKKKLDRGTDFGAITNTSRFRGKYRLTAKAELYLEEKYP